ncbi:hypothetical protein [Algisphaera agarilytica]|uniref:Uncharacterized protein n=1 Tax=Algisphaera agarilytica TaxID=1385975 RepID=A0A7X0H8I6_9BACT|nr:hypothetical protein [Algisphaera agarilytica]MBB6429774.1 hypothetical protein [Algisphaera agarilytica]
MGTNYLPSREAELLSWALNFSNLVEADPPAYGLTEPQTTAFGAQVVDFQQRYNVCQDPGTRTPTKVQEKNDAKKGLIAAARSLVRIVQGYPGTSDSMRRDLDITIRDMDPTPVPVPETSPELTVVVVQGRKITIKLRSAENSGRARPSGVKGATLYYTTGEDYPQDINAWHFKGMQSRTTIEVTIPDTVPGGTKVWLTAQWANTKLQSGPACPPVETRIAGGLSQAA